MQNYLKGIGRYRQKDPLDLETHRHTKTNRHLFILTE